MSKTLLLLLWGPAPFKTLLAFVANLTTNETLPLEVSPSLPMLTTALVTVTISALALLALVKLLLLTILTLVALMAVRTLLALPKTSLSVPETP